MTEKQLEEIIKIELEKVNQAAQKNKVIVTEREFRIMAIKLKKAIMPKIKSNPNIEPIRIQRYIQSKTNPTIEAIEEEARHIEELDNMEKNIEKAKTNDFKHNLKISVVGGGLALAGIGAAVAGLGTLQKGEAQEAIPKTEQQTDEQTQALENEYELLQQIVDEFNKKSDMNISFENVSVIKQETSTGLYQLNDEQNQTKYILNYRGIEDGAQSINTDDIYVLVDKENYYVISAVAEIDEQLKDIEVEAIRDFRQNEYTDTEYTVSVSDKEQFIEECETLIEKREKEKIENGEVEGHTQIDWEVDEERY